MNRAQKVAVIGLGTAGSQTLLECARRGLNVHGYEQHIPGHDAGAAGGGSRLYRKVLFEDKRYWPLAQIADEKWSQLEKDTQELLRHPTGCLVLGPRDHRQMRAASSYISEYEVDAEHFETARSRERFPHFRFDENDEAIFDRRAAVIRPERTIRVAVREAVRLGAEVRENTPVSKIAESSSGVTVTTNSGRTAEYDTVVLATGPWLGSNEFLPTQGIVVKRPISGWYIMRTSRSSELDYGFIRTGPEHFYGVGAMDHYEVKVGLSADRHQIEGDPYGRDPVAAPAEIEPLNSVVAKYIPVLDPNPIRSQAYMEAYAADGHPLVGFSPGKERVILATAFSGKGFKFAPAIGAIVADLVADGTSRCPIDLFDPARLSPTSSQTTS